MKIQNHPSYRSGNDVQLLFSGAHYFELMENIIATAQQSIHLQVYIFEEDETGKLIANALKKAAKRGVKVFVVVDTFGSGSLSASFIKEMISSGIYFRRFSPFVFSKRLQMRRRLHRKVIVADGNVALIGGINIADKYKGTENQIPWLDFAVKLKGAVCKDVFKICSRIWYKKLPQHILYDLKNFTTIDNEGGKISARIRQNDWIGKKYGISKSYKNAFRHAEKSITLVASYFLPGFQLRRMLRKASERGVHVNLILSEISDVPLTKYASCFLYDWLFRHKIHVYEYKQTVLHGKVAIVDNEWSTVGSYNLNHLSEYGSLELNVDILDKEFAHNFDEYLAQIMKNECKLIIPEEYVKNKTLIAQFRNWLAYQTLRLFMRLLYVLTKKEYENVLI